MAHQVFFEKCCAVKISSMDRHDYCLLCLGEEHQVDICTHCAKFMKRVKQNPAARLGTLLMESAMTPTFPLAVWHCFPHLQGELRGLCPILALWLLKRAQRKAVLEFDVCIWTVLPPWTAVKLEVVSLSPAPKNILIICTWRTLMSVGPILGPETSDTYQTTLLNLISTIMSPTGIVSNLH